MNQSSISNLAIRDLPASVNIGKWWMKLGGAMIFYFQNKTTIDFLAKNHVFRNGIGDLVATGLCKNNTSWYPSIPVPPYQY